MAVAAVVVAVGDDDVGNDIDDECCLFSLLLLLVVVVAFVIMTITTRVVLFDIGGYGGFCLAATKPIISYFTYTEISFSSKISFQICHRLEDRIWSVPVDLPPWRHL